MESPNENEDGRINKEEGEITPMFVEKNYDKLKELINSLEKEKQKGTPRKLSYDEEETEDSSESSESSDRNPSGITTSRRKVRDDVTNTIQQSQRNKRRPKMTNFSKNKRRNKVRRSRRTVRKNHNKDDSSSRSEGSASHTSSEYTTEGSEEDPVDELNSPYKPSIARRFTPRIANCRRPSRMRMPSHVRIYDGTTDPEDHLSLFSGVAEMEQWSMPLWCHMFAQTLSAAARVWYDNLPEGSIDSFEQLRQSFVTHFSSQKRYTRHAVEIHDIKQKDNESLQDFMDRFKTESIEIKGTSELMQISGFMHGIRNRQLIEKLNNKVPGSTEEMFEVTKAFIRGKEAAASQMPDPNLKRSNNSKGGHTWKSNTHSRPFVTYESCKGTLQPPPAQTPAVQ